MAVIGGGEVALRKVNDLIEAGAGVTVISPDVHPEIQSRGDSEGNPVILRRRYMPGDLEGAALAFSATDSADINAEVYREAQARGIFINAVDDPDNCSFIIPSSFSRGDLTVSISTGGASPAMAARVRRLLERSVPDTISEVLEALKEARFILKTHDYFSKLDTKQRGEILKSIVAEDRLLEELMDHRRKNTLAEFLKQQA